MKENEENIIDDCSNEKESNEQMDEEEQIAFNTAMDQEKLESIVSFINNNFGMENTLKEELINFKKLISFIKNNNYKISILESEKILDSCDRLENTLDLIYDKVENTNNTSIQSILNTYSSRKFADEQSSLDTPQFELSDNALFNTRYRDHGINLVKLYFNEIAGYRLLSPEEEKNLAYKIQAGDKNAYDELVNCNLKLAAHFAKQYVTTGVPFFDLIQAGNEGLLKAASKFDPTKGFRFSTYATWWVKQSITRSIADTGRVIRIPVHQYDMILKVKKEIGIYTSNNNGEIPTDEYLAETLDLSIEKIKLCKELMINIDSLSTPVGEDGDTELGEFIEDDNNSANDTINTLFYSQFKEAFENTTSLTQREKEVLKYRNGFYNGRIYTLDEIGKKLNVTRERIRQIEAKAIRKLSRNTDIRSFAPEGYKVPTQIVKPIEKTTYTYYRANDAYDREKYSRSLEYHDSLCLKVK